MEGKKETESTKEEENDATPKGTRSAAQSDSPKRSPLKGPGSRENTRVKTETPEKGLSEAPIQKRLSETPQADTLSTKEKIPSAQRSEAKVPSAQRSEAPVSTNATSQAPISSTVQIAEPQKPEGPISAQRSEVPLIQGSQAPLPSTVQINEPQKSDVPINGGQLSEQPVPSRKSLAPSVKVKSDSSRVSATNDKMKAEGNLEGLEEVPSEAVPKKRVSSRPEGPTSLVGCLTSGISSFENFSCSKFIGKRSPFVHNPPRPEERRLRIDRPRSPRDYIINLREDLADFQESHGLPRSRDYSFMSLGLALAQETARAICSVFLMFSELFPVIAIISLVLRFALDKLIDILETNEPVPKLKKTLVFCLQMVMILIPLWILIGTIVLPLAGLLFSIFRKLVRFKGGKSGRSCGQTKKQAPSGSVRRIEGTKKSCSGSSG